MMANQRRTKDHGLTGLLSQLHRLLVQSLDELPDKLRVERKLLPLIGLKDAARDRFLDSAI